MTLRVVTNENDSNRENVYDIEADGGFKPDAEDMPLFEGNKVDFYRLKLTSASGLEVDHHYVLDEPVKLIVEGRVTAIGHIVDEKTGKLQRVHTIKVVEAIDVPADFDTDLG